MWGCVYVCVCVCVCVSVCRGAGGPQSESVFKMASFYLLNAVKVPNLIQIFDLGGKAAM